jgi:hypothetical protein
MSLPLMALGGLAGLYGSSKNAREMRRLQRLQMEMFKKGMAALDKGLGQSFGMFDLGRRELEGSKKAATGAYQTSKREMTAGQQQAQSLMENRAKQEQKGMEATSYGRGLSGTTIGRAGAQAALASMGQLGQSIGAANAQARAQLAMQYGGQMAQLGVSGMGQAMQGANMALQGATAKANLYGSFTPLANTAKGDFFSGLGGMLMGVGGQSLLGGLGASSGSPSMLPPGGMGMTMYGPGFGVPYNQMTAGQFGFSPYVFGGQ